MNPYVCFPLWKFVPPCCVLPRVALQASFQCTAPPFIDDYAPAEKKVLCPLEVRPNRGIGALDGCVLHSDSLRSPLPHIEGLMVAGTAVGYMYGSFMADHVGSEPL